MHTRIIPGYSANAPLLRQRKYGFSSGRPVHYGPTWKGQIIQFPSCDVYAPSDADLDRSVQVMKIGYEPLVDYTHEAEVSILEFFALGVLDEEVKENSPEFIVGSIVGNMFRKIYLRSEKSTGHHHKRKKRASGKRKKCHRGVSNAMRLGVSQEVYQDMRRFPTGMWPHLYQVVTQHAVVLQPEVVHYPHGEKVVLVDSCIMWFRNGLSDHYTAFLKSLLQDDAPKEPPEPDNGPRSHPIDVYDYLDDEFHEQIGPECELEAIFARERERARREALQRQAFRRKQQVEWKKLHTKKEREASYKAGRDKRNPAFQEQGAVAVGVKAALGVIGAVTAIAGWRKMAGAVDMISGALKGVVNTIKQVYKNGFWVVAAALVLWFIAGKLGLALVPVIGLFAAKYLPRKMRSFVRQLFNNPEQMVEQGPIETIAQTISGLFCFTAFKSKAPRGVVDTFARQVAMFDRTSQGLGSFITWLGRTIQGLINSMLSLFTEFRLNFFANDVGPLNQWVEDVRKMHRDYAMNRVELTPQAVSRLLELIDMGSIYRTAYRGTPNAALVERTYLEAVHTATPYLAAKSPGAGVRTEPVGIILTGQPGIGKTVMTRAFCTTIMLESGIMPAGSTEKEISEQMHQRGSSKFNNGYVGQAAWIEDDIFASRTATGMPTNDYREFMKMVSSWSLPLDMADLESKGRIFFVSKILFGTTNVLSFTSEAQNVIVDVEAVNRRIHFGYKVAVKPEYALPDGKIDPVKAAVEQRRCLDAVKQGVADRYGAYPWYMWTARKHDFLTGHTDADIVEMADLLKLIVERVKLHQVARENADEAMAGICGARAFEQQVGGWSDRADLDLDSDALDLLNRFGFVAKDGIISEDEMRVVRTEFRNFRDVDFQGPFRVTAEGRLVASATREVRDRFEREDSVDDHFCDVVESIEPFLGEVLRGHARFKSMHVVEPYKEQIQSALSCLKRYYDAVEEGIPWGLNRGYYADYSVDVSEARRQRWTRCRDMFARAMHFLYLEKRIFESFPGIRKLWESVKIFLASFTVEIDKKWGFDPHCPAGDAGWKAWMVWFAHAVGVVLSIAYGIRLWMRIFSSVTGVIGKVIAGFFKLFGFGSKSDQEFVEQSNAPDASPTPKSSPVKPTPPVKIQPMRVKKNAPMMVEHAGPLSSQPILSKVYNNTYKMFITAGDATRRYGQVTFLDGGLCVMPWHFVKYFEEQCLSGDAIVTLRSAQNPDQVITLPGKTLVAAPRYEMKDRDVLFMDLPVRAHKNIVRAFINEKQIPYIQDRIVTLAVMACDSQSSPVNPALHHSTVMLRNNNVCSGRIVERVWHYCAVTQVGDCGAPLLNADARTFGGQEALGFHIGGDLRNEAIAAVVTQEMIASARANFVARFGRSSSVAIEDCFEDDCKVFLEQFHTTLDTTADAIQDSPMDYGSFVTIGKLSTNVAICRKNAYFNTDLKDAWGEDLNKPSIMCPITVDGEVVDPMDNARAPYATPLRVIDDWYLAPILYEALKPLNERSADFPRWILSFEQACEGVEHMKFSSLPRGTGAGFPWNLVVSNGKREILGEDGAFDYSTPWAIKLRERVDTIISEAKRGRRLMHIFQDFLKDELRPPHKIASVSTRLISAAPLDYTIAWRMYFGAFTAAVMTKNVETGFAPGSCTYSDWSRIATFIQGKGRKVFDGDFKSFDASQMPGIFAVILDAVNRWYSEHGGTEEDNLVRRVLFLDLMHSRHIGGRYNPRTRRFNETCWVYQWCHSLPSGHPFTTIINSIYSMFLLVAAFFFVTGKLNFWNSCRALTFGDDNLVNPSDEVADVFTQQAVAEQLARHFGVVYTSGAKDGLWHEGTGLKDVTFLKRRFLLDGELLTCPLELKSFLYTPYWCKNPKDVTKITRDNLEMVLQELSLHEPAVWDEYAPKIIAAMRKYRTSPRWLDNRDFYRRQVMARDDLWY